MRSSPKVRQYLRRLAAKNDGVLSPEFVVEAARPIQSPIHNAFQWDDSEAARLYRIFQARQLLNTVVKVVKINGKNQEVRVFVSLTPDRGFGYRDVSVVMKNREFRQQLIEDACNEMRSFQQKYRQLVELEEVFNAMKRAFVKFME